MSAYSGINYKEDHFEKAELTRITGQPKYASLETLLKQLKANARNVHSNLGGGQYGHLGLVISPNSYALIANVPFNRPAFPGAHPVIPPGTTQHMCTTIRNQHKEDLRVFHEVQNVDKALKQQIVAALNPSYLDAIRDRTSDTITIPVYDVMDHLFTLYGKITPETFQTKEAEVKALDYNPLTPIDTIFKQIEDLIDLSGRAHVPMTPAQSVTIAYISCGEHQFSKNI